MLERLGRWSPTQHRVLLVAGCAILYLIWLTYVPLTEIDESRYAEATREMVTPQSYTIAADKQQWMQQMSQRMAQTLPFLNAQSVNQAFRQSYRCIIPYFNQHTRYQKPVLTYWMMSASVHMLGISEFSLRLPSGILSIILVLLLYQFLHYWLPRRVAADAAARARGAALLGAITIATMPLIAIWARAATTDIITTFFTTCALLAMLHVELLRGEDAAAPARRWYLLTAVAISLAVLAKGPIGLVIPGLTWLLYHGMQRNLAAEARRVPWVTALLILIVIATPWYLATYLVDGWGFLIQFFMNENLARFTTVMEGHGTNNRFVALALCPLMALITLFPYSPFLIHDFIRPLAGRAHSGDDLLLRMRRFAVIWLFVDIGSFCVSKTQLPSYTQAIAAAVAIIFTLHVYYRRDGADAVDNSSQARWGRGVELTLLLVLGLLFTAGPIYALVQSAAGGPLGEGVPFPHPMTEVIIVLLGLAAVPLFIGILRWSIARRPTALLRWLLPAWTLVLMILILGVAPLVVRSGYQNSVAVGRFLQTLPGKAPVFMYCKHASESVVYYSHRQLMFYGTDDTACIGDVRRELATQGTAIIVADGKGWQRLNTITDFDVNMLRQYGSIRVVQVSPRLHAGQETAQTFRDNSREL